jgi:octaprenyl-diphosphate synthase
MTGVAGEVRLPATAALREIQAPIRPRLDEVMHEMHRLVTASLPMIEEVSGHLLQMRGKMFRPTLALLASEVEQSPEPRAVTLAAALELMHLATLVHDDSVDHSALRRGLPTINALFSHQVSVIMGDFLYTRCLAALVEVGDMEVLRIMVNVSNDLTMGEMRQLAAVEALEFSEPDYEDLIRSKTASLLAAACEIGSMCGASAHRRALRRYGESLGMAFQVADDILDYVEETAITGKPSGNDLREHKVTLPLIAALRTMSPAARKRVESLFSHPAPTDGDITEVVGIVNDHGGIEYARERGASFAAAAGDALSELPDSPARASLAEAIGYVMDRRS